MFDIFLAALFFTFMLLILRGFSTFKVDNQQAIIVNYFVAGILGFISSDSSLGLHQSFSQPWFYHALGIGLMFVTVFNMLAFSSQKVGLTVPTVANKMSVVIPVVVAVVLYGDSIGLMKIIGILLALLGIFFSSTSSKGISFPIKYLPLILFIFVGQGIADAILNDSMQKGIVRDQDNSLYFAIIFFVAASLGLLFLLVKTKGKASFNVKSLLGGIVLGIPNYLTLLYFAKALSSGAMESSKIYPIINLSVIIMTAIGGIILFREKLSQRNWIGILLGIAAILCLGL
jgi:drug/metabolite transporter (DMT)-like permease